ncbi:MAG: hypothetical protein SNJ58_02900 [Aggregatilineales bacterium]
MPRTTLNDRARKARIREREVRRLRAQLALLEHITPAQLQALQQAVEAAERGTPLLADSPYANDLVKMGVLRVAEGRLIPTKLGREYLEDLAESE